MYIPCIFALSCIEIGLLVENSEGAQFSCVLRACLHLLLQVLNSEKLVGSILKELLQPLNILKLKLE